MYLLKNRSIITAIMGIPIFCIALSPAYAKKANFSGAWTSKWCDNSRPNIGCGGFYLYLHQEGDRICGEHFVATQGLGRQDEGQPGSVVGTMNGDTLTLIILSGRNNARYMATAKISGNKLTWKMTGKIQNGENEEPPIIPLTNVLIPDKKQSQIEHFRNVSKSCYWPDDPRYKKQ